MPELRKDPVVGRWVIISAERGKRPTDWEVEPLKKVEGFCPFCPGNEDKTPPEIHAIRQHPGSGNAEGWHIRVVSNKFPALKIEGELYRRGEGLYDLMNGIGAHEVIIETPDHTKAFAEYEEPHIEKILQIFRDRILDLKQDVRFKYILVFKNNGVAAGASLEHSHSQLIATPILPKRVSEELEGAQKHFELKERCIYCDIIRQELSSARRVIYQTEQFVALAPFAARFPYETWILPKHHISHYEQMDAGLYGDLAHILKEILTRIGRALDEPPYNFVIHTYPVQEPDAVEYHWHLEIIPKLTKIAGFEWGSGFYINPVPPEAAAAHIRDSGTALFNG